MHGRSAFLLLAGTSMVAAAETGTVASVGFASNYVWRGMTRTADGPVVFGGVDHVTANGAYIGMRTFNIEDARGTSGLRYWHTGDYFGSGEEASYTELNHWQESEAACAFGSITGSGAARRFLIMQGGLATSVLASRRSRFP